MAESLEPKPKRKSTRSRAPNVERTGKTGRPRIIIDEAMLELMCRCQEQTDIIADAMKVSTDTLERRYGEQMRQWRAQGKMSLRRTMYQGAMGGNVTLMIFYAKNYLGMKDVVEQNGVQLHAHVPMDSDKARTALLEKLNLMDERLQAHPLPGTGDADGRHLVPSVTVNVTGNGNGTGHP